MSRSRTTVVDLAVPVVDAVAACVVRKVRRRMDKALMVRRLMQIDHAEDRNLSSRFRVHHKGKRCRPMECRRWATSVVLRQTVAADRWVAAEQRLIHSRD